MRPALPHQDLPPVSEATTLTHTLALITKSTMPGSRAGEGRQVSQHRPFLGQTRMALS
jgi:hypothetical protein